MLFDTKAEEKGKRTCSTGRAAALPIQQLGETTMKTKPDRGVQRTDKRLLIDRISNYLSPPAAKPALFQQLQNTIEMLYQCPLTSCLSRLLIFYLSNTEHEENQVLLTQQLPTNSRDFSPAVLLKTENCICLAHSIPQNTVVLNFQCSEKSLDRVVWNLLATPFT